MKLALQDIQWHLGLHAPDDGLSLHPDDAFLYTRLQSLLGKCMSVEAISADDLAHLREGLRVARGRTGNAAAQRRRPRAPARHSATDSRARLRAGGRARATETTMTCFEIAAKVYRADAPHLSDALATLYGSPTRLRCLCRDGSVEMASPNAGRAMSSNNYRVTVRSICLTANLTSRPWIRHGNRRDALKPRCERTHLAVGGRSPKRSCCPFQPITCVGFHSNTTSHWPCCAMAAAT